jgi:hypothetical protein
VDRLGVYYRFIYESGRPVGPMMKFTFSKGKGEHTFVAAGSHFRDSWYKPYKVAGSWIPQPDGDKIPVEFKIMYALVDWKNTKLKGLFDPDENSLRGTMSAPISKLKGEFVFKRDLDFVRLYPAPSVTNPHRRWEFITTSVVDHFHRQIWSRKRILRTINDGKHSVELTLKESQYGMDLPTEEEEELLALFPCLYKSDIEDNLHGLYRSSRELVFETGMPLLHYCVRDPRQESTFAEPWDVQVLPVRFRQRHCKGQENVMILNPT